MALVSISRAEGYTEAEMKASVCAHFQAMHVEEDLKPGMRVLIKPNLLAARSPSMAVTTHPMLLRAVIEWLREHGIDDIVLADSPGGIWNAEVLKKLYFACGIEPLKNLCTLNTDLSTKSRNGIPLLTSVVEADYIISCSKLKTHGLTVMSGAVKNLFGCIPGLKKPEYHCLKPSVKSFCDFLIDLCETVRPDLSLMDAVECMEGNGPGGGTVRHVGLTLCSRSPYAVDETAAKIMGLEEKRSPILEAAKKHGFLSETTQFCGDEIILADPPFTLPDSVVQKEAFFTPNCLFRSFFGKRRSFPKAIPEKCVGCGRCAESCPKHVIEIVNRKAVFHRKGCISCFCCQEMCPAHAIDVRKGL